MKQSDQLKVLFGAILLLAGTAIILFVSSAGEAILPGIIGTIAVLGMAAGALLLGISDSDGRPV